MNPTASQNRAAVAAATLGAGSMIAAQVGGKATRDAAFLSGFDITDLPTAVMVAAILSILAAFGAGRLLASAGPWRVVGPAFLLGTVLHGVEWWLYPTQPRLATGLLFLHITVVNSVLVSWFWATVTERFDPRTAKRQMSRIATGATLGGLLGGLLAERVGAAFSLSTMFPILALLSLLPGVLIYVLRRGDASHFHRTSSSQAGLTEALTTLRRHRYLRSLALVVCLGTISATLIDYVFKDTAVAALESGESLMRFFGVFYTVVSLLAFLVQSGLSRIFLEKLGLGASVGILPALSAAVASVSIFVPGLAAATTLRGTDSVLRNSLYRSGYELLYTPVGRRDKRATKTLIDVGFDRLGDAVGAAMIHVLLLVGDEASRVTMLGLVVALSIRGILGARNLQRGYVAELETRLLDSVPEDSDTLEGVSQESGVWQTLAGVDLTAVLKTAGGTAAVAAGTTDPARSKDSPAAGHAAAAASVPADPLVRSIMALRSGDPKEVDRTLRSLRTLDTALVPHVIRLLAWDEMSQTASRVLAGALPRITGHLEDALVDPDEEFAIRRRIPRVLANHPDPRGAAALFRGLSDRRFEVRFQCGRGLARIHSKGVSLGIAREAIYDAVLTEVKVDRRVWRSQRLLDQSHDEESVFVDEILKERTDRSLEHVFTLLSLELPRDPLQIAFRGLHTQDPHLRGTALEYLESILPPRVRVSLWPFLEGDPNRKQDHERSREEVLDSLLNSNESIKVNLEEVRRRLRESEE